MSKKVVFKIVCLAAFLMLSVSTIFAEEEPTTGITLTPSSLTIAGIRGTSITRTVLIQASGGEVDLQLIPLDLSRNDGKGILPASAISFESRDIKVDPKNPITIPITINLAGVGSGEYTGTLLVQNGENATSLDLTVKVKDPLVWPLITLFIGVLLSSGVSYYIKKGKNRDAVLSMIGHLTQKFDADDEYKASKIGLAFQTYVNNSIVDARVALREEKWEEANTAAKEAENYWRKWVKGRSDWILLSQSYDRQKAVIAKLIKFNTPELKPISPFLVGLDRLADDAIKQAPTKDKTDLVRDELEKVNKQAKGYDDISNAIDKFYKMVNKLQKDSEKAEWRKIAEKLEESLNEADPNQPLTEIKNQVENKMAELEKLLPSVDEQSGRGLNLTGRKAIIENREIDAIGINVVQNETSQSDIRQKIFLGASFVIGVVLLAGAGFGELYVTPDTFGSNPWGDYFSLLAWGFGAEATRNAIAGLVEGWGLPWLK
ncbi:MAG: hypothetical protein ACOYYU_04065 [Chloroflexota bacterium]